MVSRMLDTAESQRAQRIAFSREKLSELCVSAVKIVFKLLLTNTKPFKIRHFLALFFYPNPYAA